MQMDHILNGLVDIHLHTDPSLMERYIDVQDMAIRAHEFGYKAILYKEHFVCTAHVASLVQKHCFPKGDIRVFGAVALNASVGGINAYAADAAIKLGARVVWLPTTSSKHHQEHMRREMEQRAAGKDIKNPFDAVKKMKELELSLIDDNGVILPEVVEVMEVVKDAPGVSLCSGHGAPAEVDALVDKAVEMGMADKVMIDHPTMIMGASIEDCARWAAKGAIIEAVTTNGPETILKIMNAAGTDNMLLASDLGQKGNGDPVAGMDRCLKGLSDLGVDDETLRKITSYNPSKLLLI